MANKREALFLCRGGGGPTAGPQRHCPGAVSLPQEKGLERTCSPSSASAPVPAGAVIALYAFLLSPFYFHAVRGDLRVMSTHSFLSAVPEPGSAQFSGLHRFTEQQHSR